MKQEQPDDIAQQAKSTDYDDDLRVGDLRGRDESPQGLEYDGDAQRDEEDAIDKSA